MECKASVSMQGRYWFIRVVLRTVVQSLHYWCIGRVDAADWDNWATTSSYSCSWPTYKLSQLPTILFLNQTSQLNLGGNWHVSFLQGFLSIIFWVVVRERLPQTVALFDHMVAHLLECMLTWLICMQMWFMKLWTANSVVNKLSLSFLFSHDTSFWKVKVNCLCMLENTACLKIQSSFKSFCHV